MTLAEEVRAHLSKVVSAAVTAQTTISQEADKLRQAKASNVAKPATGHAGTQGATNGGN